MVPVLVFKFQAAFKARPDLTPFKIIPLNRQHGMAEIRTVTTLRAKRDEIAASVAKYKAKLAPIWRTSKRLGVLAALELDGVALEEI